MAKEYHIKQTSLEELPLQIDWTQSLPTGVTVSSIAATHTPPSGADATFTYDTANAPITWVYSPSGLVVGTHLLSVVATTSNAKISPEVLFVITVDY